MSIVKNSEEVSLSEKQEFLLLEMAIRGCIHPSIFRLVWDSKFRNVQSAGTYASLKKMGFATRDMITGIWEAADIGVTYLVTKKYLPDSWLGGRRARQKKMLEGLAVTERELFLLEMIRSYQIIEMRGLREIWDVKYPDDGTRLLDRYLSLLIKKVLMTMDTDSELAVLTQPGAEFIKKMESEGGAAWRQVIGLGEEGEAEVTVGFVPAEEKKEQRLEIFSDDEFELVLGWVDQEGYAVELKVKWVEIDFLPAGFKKPIKLDSNNLVSLTMIKRE